MRVCIGITTRNRGLVLKKAIQSAMEQDYSSLEVFVVDDGSTDSTMSLRNEFPDVRWHRFETSIGLRAARNFMMSTTDADLYCSLDDDSWFTSKDGLRQGVALFSRDPCLGAAGFEILDEGHPEGRKVVDVRPAHMFVGCGHLLRLSAAKQVGLYHDLPGAYGGEEKDLCIRLLDGGFEVLSLSGVHVWHDKTFVTRDVAQQHRSGICNDLWLTFNRAPLLFSLWLLPVKMCNHMRFAMCFAVKKPRTMSEFDQRIRNEKGRWVFIAPTIVACIHFSVNAICGLLSRHPVSTRAFAEYFRRSRLM